MLLKTCQDQQSWDSKELRTSYVLPEVVLLQVETSMDPTRCNTASPLALAWLYFSASASPLLLTFCKFDYLRNRHFSSLYKLIQSSGSKNLLCNKFLQRKGNFLLSCKCCSWLHNKHTVAARRLRWRSSWTAASSNHSRSCMGMLFFFVNLNLILRLKPFRLMMKYWLICLYFIYFYMHQHFFY